MDYSNNPVTLPLPASINRCLAHQEKPGEWCPRRYECAAHETIKHDRGIKAPAAYQKCRSDNWVGFIPLAGFADGDAA